VERMLVLQLPFTHTPAHRPSSSVTASHLWALHDITRTTHYVPQADVLLPPAS